MRPTRRQFHRLMLSGAVGLALPAAVAKTALAAPLSAGIDKAAVQAALDAVVQWPVVGSVCSVVGPADRFDTAAGRLSLASNALAQPNSIARIASVTKGMVATAAFQEIERGTLRLDSTIGEVLPGLWPGRERVTLGQLLNHTSGMPDAIWVIMQRMSLWELPFQFLSDVVSRHYTKHELVELAKQDGWWFRPGSDWGYSNTGYVVAEMMVEAAAGRPMTELIRDRVFLPAGMTRTWLEDSDLTRGAELEDYAIRPGEAMRLNHIDQSIFAGAAGVNTTAGDVTRFYQALMQGRLVSQESVEAMITPVGSAVDAGYGYGLFSVADPCPDRQGERLYGHDGGGFGSISLALASRDGSRAFAFTYTGRPYWEDGWNTVFARELDLMRTSFRSNCAGPSATLATGGDGAGQAAFGGGRIG